MMARYNRRLSAPLLDRFDLVVPLARPDPDELLCDRPGPSTAESADRVAAARGRAADRATAGDGEAPMHPDGARLLASKLRAGELSARGLHKVSRVARTVADLVGDAQVGHEHVSDALSLRKARATVVA
jgi:magnesium chelatase family protein